MASAARNDEPSAAEKFQSFAKSKGVQRTATLFNAVAPMVVLGLVFLGGQEVINSQRLVEEARQEEQQLKAETYQLSKARDALQVEKSTLETEKSTLEREKTNLQLEVLQLKGQVQELTTKVDGNDPQTVIQRVEAQLGGKTKGERADSFWRRGRDAFSNGNPELASTLFQRALQEDDTFAPAHIGMGRLAADEHMFRVAEKHYRRARKADPSNPHAAYNLALTEFILGDKEAARGLANETLQIDPNYQAAKDLLRKINE